jgi:N-methylhydantoinase A
MFLGVDVGGTFTDAVLFDGEELHTAKVPTTPGDESAGVIAAVEAVLDRGSAEPRQVERFAHGMTVGTNALLQERGARTALVATEGFTDLLDIARQNRPDLYRLCAPKPSALVAEDLRVGAAERIGPDGVVRGLDESEVGRVTETLAEMKPDAVAVCLLFSYLDPSHEEAIAARLRESLPGMHVSVSSDLLPQFREYERCSTTVIDAYLSPLIAGYLGRLAGGASELGLPEPLVMLSSGGTAPVAEAGRAGARTVLSGPAGGAVAAAMLAGLSGDGGCVGFDMGGTSCDVCVVEEGSVRRTDSRSIGGRVLQLPMVDIHTVGAGGGSIGWRDAGGALRAGPRSAGADPGPAAYGRGGTEPTVTDANLLLGYLGEGSSLAGGVRLDREAAAAAVAKLGSELNLGELETAEGIVRVANQEMARALRVVTVERGIDPRRLALMPFGGAGPMHAAALADELEMDSILCPRASGVLSALGLIAADRRRDVARTVLLSGESLSAERIAREVAALRDNAGAELETAEPEVIYEMRYRGQAFELRIQAGPEPDPAELADRFAAAHEERFGYRDEAGAVELVNIHLAMVEPGPDPRPAAGAGASPARSRRKALFGGEWAEAAVITGELPVGLEAMGPAVLEMPESTVVVPPGWGAEVDEWGTVALERTP